MVSSSEQLSPARSAGDLEGLSADEAQAGEWPVQYQQDIMGVKDKLRKLEAIDE